jgi:hypothetical protein
VRVFRYMNWLVAAKTPEDVVMLVMDHDPGEYGRKGPDFTPEGVQAEMDAVEEISLEEGNMVRWEGFE